MSSGSDNASWRPLKGAATMLAFPKQLGIGPIHVLLTPLSIQAVAPECR
jgi:hypothetical protein